jgi:hypothetical protein
MNKTEKPKDDMCFSCLKMECKNRGMFAGNKAEINTVFSRAEIFIGLGIPVLAFILGFFLIFVLFPDSGEPARAAGGVVFMFSAAIAFYIYRAKHKHLFFFRKKNVR